MVGRSRELSGRCGVWHQLLAITHAAGGIAARVGTVGAAMKPILSNFNIKLGKFIAVLALLLISPAAWAQVHLTPFSDPANPLSVTTGAGSWTFTRATVANYTHPTTGLITQAASGAARIETGGISIEDQRQNVFLNSRALGSSTASNVNVADNAYTAPNGETESELLTATDANGTVVQEITGTAATWSYSVYLRRKIGKGVINVSCDGTTWSPCEVGTDSWRRCEVSATLTAAAYSPGIQITTSGDSVYAWQGQAEVGANASSPIYTAAAPVTRDADVLSFVGTSFPTAAGTYFYEYDQPNTTVSSTRIRTSGGSYSADYGAAQHTVGDSTNTVTYSSYIFPKVKNKVAVSWGATGLRISCNGLPVESGSFDGNKGWGSTLFWLGSLNGASAINGHIKNFTVWDTQLDDTFLQVSTKTTDYSTQYTSIPGVGHPVYGYLTDTIWALKKVGATYTGIVYSYDWGATWNIWLDWGNNYPTAQTTLAMDKVGNFYFSTSSTLYRVNRQTKAITTAITYYPEGQSFSFMDWLWGFNVTTGRIFVGQYGGNLAPYIWTSTDDGANWSRIDVIKDTYAAIQHIHSIHVSPFDGSVYLSWGDDPTTRGLGVSTDNLATPPTVITDAAQNGPTVITFTSEAVYSGTDVSGNANYIKSNDGSETTARYTMIGAGRLAPFFGLRAVGDNELWGCTFDDQSLQTLIPSVFRMQKNVGITSAWKLDYKSFGNDPVATGTNYSYVAQDGTGVIPQNVPYVFVSVVSAGTGSGGVPGVIRFARNGEHPIFISDAGFAASNKVVDCSNDSADYGVIIESGATGVSLSDYRIINCPGAILAAGNNANIRRIRVGEN